MVYSLHELRPGERAEIVWAISESPMSLRLEELGFTVAVQVTRTLKGRCDHMSVYQIRDTIIVLRPQNVREVLIRTLNPG